MFLNLCSLGLLGILRSHLVDEEESFRFFERMKEVVGIRVVFLQNSAWKTPWLEVKEKLEISFSSESSLEIEIELTNSL